MDEICDVPQFYSCFSRGESPNDSVCFLALSLRSAILEFLCATARAANSNGY